MFLPLVILIGFVALLAAFYLRGRRLARNTALSVAPLAPLAGEYPIIGWGAPDHAHHGHGGTRLRVMPAR